MIDRGDRILEVGSHHGLYSMLLGHCVGERGFVLWLEAEAQNAQIAQSQVVLNHMGNRCLILYGAGADEAGVVSVSTTDGSNAYVVEQSERHSMSVEAMTGDQLQEIHGPFSVLKIDVEGFEARVLKGCKNILATRPKLVLELHSTMLKRYGTRLEEVFKLINVDEYEGCMIVLPNLDNLFPFDSSHLSNKHIVNIFLRPKE